MLCTFLLSNTWFYLSHSLPGFGNGLQENVTRLSSDMTSYYCFGQIFQYLPFAQLLIPISLKHFARLSCRLEGRECQHAYSYAHVMHHNLIPQFWTLVVYPLAQLKGNLKWSSQLIRNRAHLKCAGWEEQNLMLSSQFWGTIFDHTVQFMPLQLLADESFWTFNSSETLGRIIQEGKHYVGDDE